MKKVLIFFVSICLSASLWAQTEIDKINSDSSALKFFKEQVIKGSKESNYNDFKLTDGKEWVDFYNFSPQQKEALLSQYKYTNWAKIDLNNDKKNDLIISGYLSKTIGFSRHYRTFIFLTQPNNSIEFLRLNSSDPQYFRIINLDTSKFIELSRWQNDLYKKEENIPLRIDTLSYNIPLQMLVDYKILANPSSIKKVVYRENYLPKGFVEATVVNNLGRNSDFTIRVDAQDGTRADVNNAKISQDLMKDFLDVTSRLKKYDLLPGNPAITNESDLRKSVEVEYTDGSKIVIEDNIAASSFTLAAIYAWFEYSINNVYEQIGQRQQNYDYYYDPFGW